MKNQKKRKYITKKRRVQLVMRKTIVVLLTFSFAVGCVGNASVKLEKEIDTVYPSITYKNKVKKELKKKPGINKNNNLPGIPVKEIRQRVANRIREIAKERNFKWADYAVNIACEESLLGTATINTQGNYPANSIDRGYYQINNYWHSEISDDCANDIDCATNFFIDMVEEGRQHEWAADKKVKGKKNYSLNKCGVQ